MSPAEASINLKVLLPFRVFAARSGVRRIVAQTVQGALGLLPHRLDCAAALAPGILTYESDSEGEVYLAIDQGVLVKTGMDVLIAVHRATQGKDLGTLHELVKREFLALGEEEKAIRSASAKIESGFLRNLLEFRHG
jgi:F-type H+-transporting ATPase subunit epsilon